MNDRRKILPLELPKKVEDVRKRISERISPRSPPSAPLQVGGGALLERGRSRIATIVAKAKVARPGVFQKGMKRAEQWTPGARIKSAVKPGAKSAPLVTPLGATTSRGPAGAGEEGF